MSDQPVLTIERYDGGDGDCHIGYGVAWNNARRAALQKRQEETGAMPTTEEVVGNSSGGITNLMSHGL